MNDGQAKLEWSQTIWNNINKAVQDEAKRTKVAAQFLPLHITDVSEKAVPSDQVNAEIIPLLAILGICPSSFIVAVMPKKYKRINLSFTALATELILWRKLVSHCLIAFIAVVCTDQTFAFSGNWNFAWGDTKYTFANMGTTDNRTCFLSGIAGDIKPTGQAGGGQTGAGVDISNGKYQLFVDPQKGRELNVYARCVNTAAGKTAEISWQTGQAAQVLAPVTANRRCFLTKIVTSTQDASTNLKSGFQDNSDYVKVWKDSDNWYIGGEQSGQTWVRAACIDVNVDLGNWQYTALDPGNRKDPLSQTGGATCFLTGVGGRFNHSDWFDGVFITYDAGINQFFMNTKNGKTGWANCVK